MKILGRRNFLIGIHKINKNGKAKEAAVDFTIHKITKIINCMAVKICILNVFTWKKKVKYYVKLVNTL